MQLVVIPVVVQRQVSWSRLSVGPFPSPVNTVVDVPIVQVVLAIPVVRRQVRKAQTLQNSVEVPQLQFIKFVDISCCGAEADSHGPCDHGDSTVAVH